MNRPLLQKHLLLTAFTFIMTLPLAAQIPNFSFQALDGNTYTASQLPKGKSIFVMLFDPGCEHCQTQAKNIGDAADKFQNVKFVFVSMFDDKAGIEQFGKTYFGDKGLDVTFLIDPSTGIDFETYFGYTDDPVYIHLFKPNGQKYAYKYFGHEQSAGELLKHL